MLNHSSPVPLYHQLADILRERIRSGEYTPGIRIPSEHQLAATYGIGRPTARQAVDVLVRKGLLARRKGAGTFVRKPDKEVDLFSLAGTLSAFQKKGLPVTTRILHKTRLKSVGKNSQNPFAGAEAYYFSRLSQVEGEPVLMEDLYLHPSIFKGIDEIDLAGRSLSRVVEERFYMRPTGGKQNFRIGYVDGKKASNLDVEPTEPILIVNRFLHFSQAENAIYSELFCRTDRFVFSQEIGGMSDV
jgi:DNA-binding GntR family transcriptional regulator